MYKVYTDIEYNADIMIHGKSTHTLHKTLLLYDYKVIVFILQVCINKTGIIHNKTISR